ncbi:uncharacterized protein LOC126973480 [Leptidea sinapis]|uniref:uncharacterized protein LOC126973480 n=1 Tax=Leptidea sinapis TaxID=189913 RepID=UPI0021C49C21|nr:uncharacterized protein LOC126973480 [Leptidea sinapis]
MDSRVFSAAAIFLAAYCLKKRKQSRIKKKPRRFWIRKMYERRHQYGNRLLGDLVYDQTVHNFTQEFENLCSLLSDKIKKCDTKYREAITVNERVLITLRFLATGDSYSSLQYLFRVTKQSISRIVPEVCDAIIEALSDYVKIPSTEEEWLAISKEFENKWNFPHAIGAMDGKHVMLQAPINSGTDYDNYKQFPSIVLFGLVDASYNFLCVNVGSKGRISDGGVFKSTTLYKKLEKKELNVPKKKILEIPYVTEVPYFILSDKAFALNEYTMKPFEGNPENGSKERIFNYRLSRARRVVENAFGILSAIFRVFRKPILLEPNKATKVVLAAVYLYNYIRKNTSTNLISPELFDRELDGALIPGQWRN